MEIFKNATKVAGVCLKNKNMYVCIVNGPSPYIFKKVTRALGLCMYVVDKMNSPVVLFIQNHSVEN